MNVVHFPRPDRQLALRDRVVGSCERREVAAPAQPMLSFDEPLPFDRAVAQLSSVTGQLFIPLHDAALVCCDEAIQAAMATGLFRLAKGNTLKLIHRGAARRLDDLIATVTAGSAAKAVLRPQPGNTTWLVEGFPPNAVAHGAGGLVIFRRLDRVSWSPRDLAEAFGYTPREADVALALLDGLRVTQIAEMLHLKVQTVRWHVRNIYSKTRVRNQSDLVAVLQGSIAL